MNGALKQVKVLDFTQAFAGPFCTQSLAELGATVVKVERPGKGDGNRGIAPLTESGESNTGIILNRGKQSITLNLKSEKGKRMALDLAAQFDVVVENFSPGTMDKMGLGYNVLGKLNPGLIYASLAGFGQTGPRQAEPAWDSIAQASGGLMCVNGFSDRPPLRVGIVIADLVSGLYTTVAILAALQHRAETGQGQAIDISMQDCIWALTAIEHLPGYAVSGKIPPRTGNRTWLSVPSNNFPTQDGWVRIVASNPNQWDDLLRAMGRSELIGKPDYTLSYEWINRADEIDQMVGGWTRTLTTEETLSRCVEHDVPCARIPTFDQVVNDPQLLAREMIAEVAQSASEKVKVPGSVYKMTRTPGKPDRRAAPLGETNDQVYSELLGLSEKEIKELAAEGVI
jgi:CoA:oxalate CoA-transferase